MRVWLLGIAVGTLLFASLMDLACCQVYRFLWWICGGAGMALLLMQSGTLAAEGRLFCSLADWGVFCLLQQGFFSKSYGRADCFAFCCCSLFFCARGGGLKEYFVHMLLSFGLAGAVQALRHNIDQKGNFKEPIPFIPYIAAAFFILWIWNTEGKLTVL